MSVITHPRRHHRFTARAQTRDDARTPAESTDKALLERGPEPYFFSNRGLRTLRDADAGAKRGGVQHVVEEL
jgi:hypothetical protein